MPFLFRISHTINSSQTDCWFLNFGLFFVMLFERVLCHPWDKNTCVRTHTLFPCIYASFDARRIYLLVLMPIQIKKCHRKSISFYQMASSVYNICNYGLKWFRLWGSRLWKCVICYQLNLLMTSYSMLGVNKIQIHSAETTHRF